MPPAAGGVGPTRETAKGYWRAAGPTTVPPVLAPGARPLLAAKLIVPPPRRGAVVRSRLHERLLPVPGARLTTVVAPAGWGKTTLLAAWAHDPAEQGGLAPSGGRDDRRQPRAGHRQQPLVQAGDRKSVV